MRLLFDANLSPQLVRLLLDIYSGSMHVEQVGLTSSDHSIWKFALENDLTIVTKDDDFRAMALVFAPPGKVVLITVGNCTTRVVEEMLRTEFASIQRFVSSTDESLIVLP